MAAGNNRSLLVKTTLTIVGIVVAYFSVVSTMTISRVSSIEKKINHRAEEISRNEKNIAVLLEKVTTVERLIREIRQEMTKLTLDREDAPSRP
jgi:septal ring factor EnvC (AmiA/AmiB activator)